MDGSVAPIMAVTRKKAEQQVAGLEWPLNLHLVKLLGFDAPEATRQAWKREVREWCTQVATLRIKPANRPLPARTLLAWLHDERFQGSEAQNVAAMLALPEGLRRNGQTPEAVAARLHEFHVSACAALAAGQVPAELIAAL